MWLLRPAGVDGFCSSHASPSRLTSASLRMSPAVAKDLHHRAAHVRLEDARQRGAAKRMCRNERSTAPVRFEPQAQVNRPPALRSPECRRGPMAARGDWWAYGKPGAVRTYEVLRRAPVERGVNALLGCPRERLVPPPAARRRASSSHALLDISSRFLDLDRKAAPRAPIRASSSSACSLCSRASQRTRARA